MAGLRRAGIVRSEKGHGGGWSLGRKLDDVTLAECKRRDGKRPHDDRVSHGSRDCERDRL